MHTSKNIWRYGLHRLALFLIFYQLNNHSGTDLACKVIVTWWKAAWAHPCSELYFLAASAQHSGDWLHAFPFSFCGLRLDDEAVRVVIGLRLGMEFCVLHQCHCGTKVAAMDLFARSSWQINETSRFERTWSSRSFRCSNTKHEGTAGFMSVRRKTPWWAHFGRAVNLLSGTLQSSALWPTHM